MSSHSLSDDPLAVMAFKITWFAFKWSILLPFYALRFGIPIVADVIGSVINFARGRRLEAARKREIEDAQAPLGREPTLEELQMAPNLLRLARKDLDEYWNSTEDAVLSLAMLGRATKAVAKARKFDPGASFSSEEGHTYTVDSLSAELCYAEASAYYAKAEAILFAPGPSFEDLKAAGTSASRVVNASQRARDTESKEMYRRALQPAKQAVAYAPNDVRCHLLLAKVYSGWGNEKLAKECVARAYQLEPHNPEVLGYML